MAAAELTQPAIAAFRSRHPGVALDVPLGARWGRHQPDLDVVLYRGSGTGRDNLTVLVEEPRVVTVLSGHRLAGLAAERGGGLSASDLEHEVLQDTSLLQAAECAFNDPSDLTDVFGLAAAWQANLSANLPSAVLTTHAVRDRLRADVRAR